MHWLNFLITGRSRLLPVVGHSVATSNVWRLNPNNLRFSLNGPLPYTKVYLRLTISNNTDLRSRLLPVVGHSVATSNVWRLNPNNLRFSLNGPLPYTKVYLRLTISKNTVNVLIFRTLVVCQKGLDKQCRPRSDCFCRSSLIRVFSVCYSDKLFL